MGERAGTRASAATAADMGARLRDLSATTADARRGLAAAGPLGPGDLLSRLAVVADGLSQTEADPSDDAPLLVLLDEIGGLVGQLELEREAVRARLVALDRHRHAQLSYAKSHRPQ